MINKLSKVENRFSVSSGSRFRQNFIKVARANVLAQLVPFLAAPLLTRLYSPDDFGMFALFSSAIAIVGAVSTLRLDWSVPNAKSRQQAAQLILIGCLVLLIVCGLLELAFLMQIDLVSFWKGGDALRDFVIWMPFVLFGAGLQQLLQAWHIREADLSPLGKAKIYQSFSSTGAQIGCGFLGIGGLGLIAGLLLNAWTGMAILVSHTLSLQRLLYKVSVRRMCLAVKRFWRESIQSTGVAVVNAASLAVLPLLFAQYYSQADVGSYSLMYRLAVAPIGLITSALGQSFWAEAAERVKSDPIGLWLLYLRTTKRLMLVAAVIMLFCLSGPFYVGWVFGREWEQAGWILAALTPMLCGQIAVSPLSHLVIHRKQHWQFWWDLGRLIGVFVVFNFGHQIDIGFHWLIAIISFFLFIMYVFLFMLNLMANKGARK